MVVRRAARRVMLESRVATRPLAEGIMVAPLFAMPPPVVLLVWPIGLLLVLLIAGLFVSATRTRGKRSERNRRASLGLAAISCGPFVGAALAWLSNSVGVVHPADVGYTYTVFAIIGAIAGLLAGVVFAITGIFAPRTSSGNAIPAKAMDFMDDL